MSKRPTAANGGRNDSGPYRLELVGLDAASERPDLVVLAVDDARNVLHRQQVDADGSFDIPPDVLKRAHRVLIGVADGKEGVQMASAASFRGNEFARQITDGTLALAEGVWSGFKYYWVCVTGNVQACRRRPWWYDSIVTAATTATAAIERAGTRLQRRAAPSVSELIYWPQRCASVCLGSVEVYRRSCCCSPIVFDDPRIPELVVDLERYIDRLPPRLPPPKRGVPPPPPPIDPLDSPFFNGGTLNELALNATADLHALRSLPREQAAHYINGRAYLYHRLCTCGTVTRVGSGTLQPDGSFNICWREALRLQRLNCYDQYAYIVRQTIGGSTNTLYDGVAGGAWFAGSDHPTLTSYSGLAFTCNETGSGDGDAYVLLDLIGDTESHELTTPPSTGWDRVAAPNAGSGLLFPGTGPNDSHLRNLGGAVELSFTFSLAMREPAVGARYYRVSISRADASGNPTGPRYFMGQGLAWQKVVGADVVPESLGPVLPATVGGELNLYRIPYSDEAWVGSVRYHALINTLSNAADMNLNLPPASDLVSAAANHLITLEVFNAAGERLRPLGTAATGLPGAEVAKAFKFRRWFQPGGSPGDDTVEVPHAALTHLFCWDNRPPVADIERLVMDTTASNAECQFLSGAADSSFAIEYRAYVADQRFQYRHSIGWLRGLNASAANGGVGTLAAPASPNNAGEPPASAVISGSNSFELMLTRINPPMVLPPTTLLPRCSFAVTLVTESKTTNGESMSYPYATETAAFALAIGP